MKRFAVFILCLALCFSVSACKEQKTVDDKTPVVINMPTDDTVNGYKVSEKGSADGSIVSADSVAVGDTNTTSKTQNSSVQSNTQSQEKYCVNVKSGVFHKMSCGSVSSMKEENKAFFTDRNKVTADGYTPCKRCNP